MPTQTSKISRRSFWILPGAVIAGLASRRIASACAVDAICLTNTETTITIRVVAGANCEIGGALYDKIRVSRQEAPAGPWDGPGVVTQTFDATGATTDVTVSGLECGKSYAFQVTPFFSVGGIIGTSSELVCETVCAPSCTRTQGYWKNHPNAWPVNSLVLGTSGNSYSKTALIAIFNTPVAGNGLILLAHQLIAAKLNVAAGAGCAAANTAIAQGDALIGSLIVGVGSLRTSAVSTVATTLDNFNNGNIASCPAHCSD